MSAARRFRIPDRVAAMVRGTHPRLKRRLRAAFDLLRREPAAGKALQGELEGLISLRIGRFRIIYRLARSGVIEIVTAGPRESIYEETLRILRKETER